MRRLGIVKVFLSLTGLLLLFIHLGASIRTLMSRNGLGAFWCPMTMNGCCYLKHGLEGPIRFYETAGHSQGFSFVDGFASAVHSSRCFYSHSDEPQWARCILVSDDDEWLLLSEARPRGANPFL